jgi:pyridoxamine 5'-phosphate oxidase-like protein
MATWAEVETQNPPVGGLGRKLLLGGGRGFLATTRSDGSPRVQAICPVVRDGRLYAGIIKATPKYRDLVRDGRFALHAPLASGDAEFWVTGTARLLSDAETADLMERNPNWQMPVSNALFHLDIESAHGTLFSPGPGNRPIPDRRHFRAAS